MIKLTRSDTQNAQGTPPEIILDTSLNVPQKPRPVVDRHRRLGSRSIIRQVSGWESVETICPFTKGFNNGEAENLGPGSWEMDTWDKFVYAVQAAMEPTTYYTWTAFSGEDALMDVTINRCMIVDFNYTVSKKRGANIYRPTPLDTEFILVEGTLNIIVDFDEDNEQYPWDGPEEQ